MLWRETINLQVIFKNALLMIISNNTKVSNPIKNLNNNI